MENNSADRPAKKEYEGANCSAKPQRGFTIFLVLATILYLLYRVLK